MKKGVLVEFPNRTNLDNEVLIANNFGQMIDAMLVEFGPMFTREIFERHLLEKARNSKSKKFKKAAGDQ